MSERKVNNLATTSAQNYAAMEITSKSDKWMIDFGIECAKNEALRNEIAALTAENSALKQQVERVRENAKLIIADKEQRLKTAREEIERLTGAIVDWAKQSGTSSLNNGINQGPEEVLRRIQNLAYRKQEGEPQPADANTSWFCVPCGFTTKDAAEAQAHFRLHMIELTCPFDGQIWRFHTQAQADMLQKHLDWHAAQLSTPTPEAR